MENNTILKTGFNFTVFFNFFIFLLTVISSSDPLIIDIAFELAGIPFDFEVNLIYMIIVVITIFGVIVATGFNALGSGLNDQSVKLLMKITAYVTLWIVLSIFTLSFLSPIEEIGSLFYLLLTIMYSLGVIEQISMSEN